MADFATRADQRIRELRRAYVQLALSRLNLGDVTGCRAAMTDCLHAQARIAGLRGAA